MDNIPGNELLIPEQEGNRIVTPKYRVRDASSAASVADRLDYQDSLASRNRAAYLALINGEAPYSPDWLQRVGRGDDTNVNFLGANAKLLAALAPYTNTISGVRNIGTFECDLADDNERYSVEAILAEEFQWVHDQWSQFHNNMQQLHLGFVRDGLVSAMMHDRINWQWGVTHWGDMKIPRNTKLGEEHVEVIKTTFPVNVTTLWQWAEKNPNWNKEACLKAIQSSPDTDADGWRNNSYNWDKLQERIKENDIEMGYNAYRPMTITQLLVKEFDGSWSLYRFLTSNPGIGMLYEQHNYFDDTDDFLVMFTSGVGNGTLHSIRGLAWTMFGAEKALNIAKCKMLDCARMAGSVIVQPKDASNLEKFASGISIGAFMLFPAEAQFPDVQRPNAATQMMPIIGQLERDSQNNTGTYMARTITPDAQDRTATEAELQVTQQGVLSNAQMELYYPPLGRLLTLSWNRLTNPAYPQSAPGGKLAKEFMRRLHKRGISRRHIDSVDRVVATRMIGNGSEAQKNQVLNKLFAMSTSFDPEGQNEAKFEIVAGLVGYRNAPRFVQRSGPRTDGGQIHAARAENTAFISGYPQTILGDDDHYLHAQQHLEWMFQTRDAVDNGYANPAQVIGAMNLGMVHTQAHWEALAQNQMTQGEAREVRQGLSQLANFVQTTTTHLNREAQKAAEQNGGNAQQLSEPSVTEQKLLEQQALFEQKMQHRQMEAEQNLFNKKRLADQQLVISDTKAAKAITQERLKEIDKATP